MAPFVLIVENNQWAYSTPVSRQVPVKNLADRAVAYGIRSWIVDGNDVIAVYNAAKEAVDEGRAGRGPALIEVKTMRMRGHAQHDPAEYVPKQMFDYWKARDPIALYEKYLTENKIWDSKAKAEIDARIERELDEDQKFAEESPMPPPELAEQGVYCDGCHTIQAEWRRPKQEVMPPASNTKAVWQVKDFGAFAGNGGTLTDAEVQPFVETMPKAATQISVPLEAEVPLRVPFGRGPKDKSFELERRDKPAPSAKPPRHK